MPEQQFDPRVDAYIEKAAPFAQPMLAHLRQLMHQACPRAAEDVKWSMPFFVQQGVILANMAAFKQHCAFGFWGSEMKKLLEKDGRNSSDAMGTLGRITGRKDLPSDKTLLTYMRHAADLVETGQRSKSIERPEKSAKKKPVSVPPELAAALKKNKVAAKAFAGFSPSGQSEYCEWIAEAKRPETKEKRLVQAIAQIAQGKSRNWKYEKR
ncbi:MAG: YdeI/OmpD-associated family protein [Candidatus Acidiferrum sp.]